MTSISRVRLTSCAAGAQDSIETVAVSTSQLKLRAAFNYNWKTEKADAGCRRGS